MPSNYTANYQLNQWEAGDRVLRTDFNADNAKIDGALTSLAAADQAEISARTALAGLVAKKGNCKIETFSYTGTGKNGSGATIDLTFSGRPVMFVIVGAWNVVISAGRGENNIYLGPVYVSQQGSSYRGFNVSMAWTGNRVSISVPSDIYELNTANKTYQVVALIAADA